MSQPDIISAFRHEFSKVWAIIVSTQFYKSLRNSIKAFTPVEYGYKVDIGRYGAYDVAYRSGTADELVIGHSFDNDIFFSSIPEYIPEESHIIIDIGAHIGTFSLLASSKIPYGRVHAIEASRETYNLLNINVHLNNLSNIDVHHLAINDKSGYIQLYHSPTNWGHSITKSSSTCSEIVKSDTLANFMLRNRIAHCDLIKFNCEGAEFPILFSTPMETLASIDRMLILYHCDLATGYDLKTLVERLEESGFSLSVLNKSEKRGWIWATRKSDAKD